MAKIWFRYMRVPEEIYFGYALPAMTGFVLMLCLPIYRKQTADEGEPLFRQFNSIKAYFKQHHKQGTWLVAVGLLFAILSSFLPSALQYIGNLFYFSSFAGILYVYYSNGMKYRRYILIGFVLFTFWYVLQSGMFTVLAYMGMTIFSFLFLGSKASLFRKVLVFVLAFFSLLLIQSVKQSYRQFVWNGQYEGSRGELFTDLLLSRVSSENNDFFSETAFFPIYYRANQGLNVSLVMKRIPAVQPFDGGVNLSRSLAASVVPRVLWPDKPEAGGKFNMKFYTGIILRGWSTNVGPLGEAYGSFGVTGGIIFMMALGLFIRWAYKRVFIIARNIPLLICWLPVLFYQVTYSAETDTLQILNSLVKSALFIWMMYKFFPALFGKSKAVRSKRRPFNYPDVNTVRPALES